MKQNDLSHPITYNPWPVIGAMVILLALTYIYNMLPAMNFTLQDDRWMLLTHENVHPSHFSFEWLWNVFSSFNENQYSPINTLYFYGIYQINGYDPYYYHLFPLIIHVFNTLLIFIICREVFQSFSIGRPVLNAYLVCLLWSIHPLNGEAVIWVCGSKILLCSCCCLLSFLFFIKGTKHDKFRFYVLSFVFFSLGGFIKEQAMVTPIMFLCYRVCLKLQNGLSAFRWERSYWWILLMLLVNVPVGIITINANRIGGGPPMLDYPVIQRIVLSFYCLSFYITNLIVPINLHYHYPFPVQPGAPMSLNYYLYPVCFIAFLILLGLLLRQNRYRFFYLMGMFVFVLQLALVLQVIPMTRPAIMADRYMYMSSLGLLLILLPPVVNGLFMKAKGKYVLSVLLGIYVIFFILYSHHLTFKWLDYNMINL